MRNSKGRARQWIAQVTKNKKPLTGSTRLKTAVPKPFTQSYTFFHSGKSRQTWNGLPPTALTKQREFAKVRLRSEYTA